MSDRRRRRDRTYSDDRAASRSSTKTDVKRSELPDDFEIPADFKGVIQINVQRASDQDTTTQTASPTITLNAVQNQLTQVQVGMGNMQGALQALQNQLQTVLLILLGAPEGLVDRQRMAADLADALRAAQQSADQGQG